MDEIKAKYVLRNVDNDALRNVVVISQSRSTDSSAGSSMECAPTALMSEPVRDEMTIVTAKSDSTSTTETTMLHHFDESPIVPASIASHVPVTENVEPNGQNVCDSQSESVGLQDDAAKETLPM